MIESDPRNASSEHRWPSAPVSVNRDEKEKGLDPGPNNPRSYKEKTESVSRRRGAAEDRPASRKAVAEFQKIPFDSFPGFATSPAPHGGLRPIPSGLSPKGPPPRPEGRMYRIETSSGLRAKHPARQARWGKESCSNASTHQADGCLQITDVGWGAFSRRGFLKKQRLPIMARIPFWKIYAEMLGCIRLKKMALREG